MGGTLTRMGLGANTDAPKGASGDRKVQANLEPNGIQTTQEPLSTDSVTMTRPGVVDVEILFCGELVAALGPFMEEELSKECGEEKKLRKANEESLKGINGGRPRGSRPPSGGPPGGGVPGAVPSNMDRKGTVGEEPTASSEAGSNNTRPSGPSSRGVGPPDGGGGKGGGTRLSELVTLEGSLRGGGGFGGCYTTWP
ncbi:hypothetical protein K435DRAFT_858840 [Dendrothele bispora CBS 962.96]|uniref:Uncharacterized protein n=1 Tax=Dendrothele bispora (strain CBS 962.96) TaxID=1314807 RepID=A0A4S8M231_DENBC|nr:hypothetical protein K435DRAFT_858840 [Dendrothele bispora CBS 962.96]